MLNSSYKPAQFAAQGRSSGQASEYTTREDDQSRVPTAQSVPPPFVCISSILRRLLIQLEVSAPRLRIAALEGLPGTGKHLFAQTIHSHSHFASMPFRTCDAREWLANEAEASSLHGTLYLDRVDLLPAGGQGLLLNLIKTIQNDPAAAPHFLLLASSQCSLRQLASQGHFLPDLAFRLTAVRFALPPLAEHREDIAPVAQALIERICSRYQQPTAVLAQGTLQRLLQHSWPGNVRELASALESAILESATGILRPADLCLDLSPDRSHLSARESAGTAISGPASGQINALPADLNLDTAIRRHIQMVLELNHGNKLRSARQLGISRSTLYRLLGGGGPAPQIPPGS